MRAYLLAGILIFVSAAASAAPQWWSGTQGQGVIYSSASAACDAALATHPSGATLFANKTLTLVSSDSLGPRQFTCAALAYYREPSSTDPNKFNFSTSVTRNTGTGCDSGAMMDTATGACIDLTSVCNSKNGMKEDSIQFPITGGVSIAPSCLGGCAVVSNGSAIILDGATSTVTSAKYTGQTCTAAGITSAATPPASGQTCGQINGKTLCLTASNPNCGTINGKNICLETAPAGSCTYLPGGSYICDSVAPKDATHRPIDANGNPIARTAGLNPGPGTSTERSADYWDASTMSNASNGSAADSKGNKVGDCVGANCGGGDGGGDNVEKGSDAQFQEWGDSCDLDCSLSELWGELNSVPLIQAFFNLGASLPNGSQCPKPVFEVFGTQIQMKTHCDLYDQVAPILSACFRFMWAFLAVVVLLKA